MALSFTCRSCELEIVTRYLEPGEEARCPHCLEPTPVPEDAEGSSAEPTIDRLIAATIERPVAEVEEPRVRPDFPGIPGVIGLMGMFVVIAVVLVLPTRFLLSILDPPQSVRQDAQLAFGLVAMLLTALWGWRMTGLPFLKVFPLRGFSPRLIGPLLLTLLGVVVFEWKVLGLLFQVFPPSETTLQGFNEFSIGASYWGFILLGVVLAPLAEEMLFRGVMLRGLTRRYGAPLAIALTAILFALLHPPLYRMPMILPVGVLLGWWCVTTGSLLPAILGHVLTNSAGGWWTLLIHGIHPGETDLPALDAVYRGPALWIVALGLLMLAGGIGWRYAERRRSVQFDA